MKNTNICRLRIISTIAVIILHVCTTMLENRDICFLDENQVVFYSSIAGMLRWCVPVFLIITGYLLLDSGKVITIETALMKYARRILFALFLFGIPFAILINLFETHKVNLGLAVINVLMGKSLSHLWYLYLLIGIYIALPVLKPLLDCISKETLYYYIIVLFVFTFVIPFINDITGEKIAFTFSMGTYAIFYLLIGKCMKSEIPKFLNRRNCLIIIIGCCIFTALASVLGLPSQMLNNYNSPFIMIFSCAVFGFGIQDSIKYTERLWKIDRLCFGVYLIHPVFIQFVYRYLKITPNNTLFYPISWIPFSAFFILCSFMASYILNKIKILRDYVL